MRFDKCQLLFWYMNLITCNYDSVMKEPITKHYCIHIKYNIKCLSIFTSIARVFIVIFYGHDDYHSFQEEKIV